MATHDVPGANPANNDELKLGCWAEHDDGSLLLVLSTEGNRVVFEMFDMSGPEPLGYRHAMPEGDFQKNFSWNKTGMTGGVIGRRIPNEKWLWHDKTPFPFDKVIQDDLLKKGPFLPASQQLSAAARVAESLKLRAAKIDKEIFREKVQQGTSIVAGIRDKFSRAFNELRK